MTITKLFTDTYKNTMLTHGFYRSGKLYYRIKGNTIQTVLLDTLSPFRILYSVYPYWCHRFVGLTCNHTIELLKKTLWAQGLICTQGVYYLSGDDDELRSVMQLCLKVFTEEILPYFDSHTDNESCLMASLEPTTYVSAQEPVIYDGTEYWATTNIASWKNQYLLLWKAHSDGTFEQAYKLFESDVRNFIESERVQYVRKHCKKPDRQKNIEEHIAMLAQTSPEMSYEEASAEAYRIWGPKIFDIEGYLEKQRQNYIKAQYDIFLSRMHENDINWIQNIIDEETEIMKKAFSEVYGIKFD